MQQPPRDEFPGGLSLKSSWDLPSPPVGATGESQGRDRCQRESDAAHKLHGVLPPEVRWPPSGGHEGIVGGPLSGGQARASGYVI